MKNNKQFLSNFIWNTIGSTISSFLSLFLMIIITRINGLENAGIFSIAFTTASIIYIFGIYSGRNCHVTDIECKIKDMDYIISRIITCIGMIILAFIFSALNNYDNYKNSLLLILCLWKSFDALTDVFYGVLQKNNKLNNVGISLTIKSILQLILFFIVDYLTKNLIFACISLPVVSLINIILYDFPYANKYINKKEKAKKENILKIYKNEFYLFACSFLIMYILNAPKYSIEKYLGDSVQAIYAIILMPASILPLFAQFIVTPIMNKLTNLHKERKVEEIEKTEHRINCLISSFGITAALLGGTIGIPILNWIYNVDLANYRMELIIILLIYILYAIGYTKTIILTIYRKINKQFIVYLVVTIVAFFVTNILIKNLKEQGIIISYAIIMLIYYLLLAIATKYEYNKGKKIK